MKHPFQTIAGSPDGKTVYVAAKNQVQAISTLSKQKIGLWQDSVDTIAFLTEQKRRKLQSEAAGEPVKVPKIPVPGPGAPPANNYIRALSVSPQGDYVVATTDTDKSVVVFKVSDKEPLKEVKRQPLPKRPCSVTLTEKSILAADKFGDVYEISYEGEVELDEKNLTPILGHVSMLTDVALAEHGGKKFVLTGDRDEHIRVLNYPKAYVANKWLFGHHEFVLALCIEGDFLISGGGDDFVCLWNWYSGELLEKFSFREYLVPYFTSFHDVPERWATENSIPEISVSLIVKVGSLIVILVENVKCLLVLKINENKLELLEVTEVESPLVDICVVGGEIIGAPAAGGLVTMTVDQGKLKLGDVWEVEGPETEDLSTLWYVNTLRKRSEH